MATRLSRAKIRKKSERGRRTIFYWQEINHFIIFSNFVFHFSHWGISLLSNA